MAHWVTMPEGVGNNCNARSVRRSVIIRLGVAIRVGFRCAFIPDHRRSLVGGALQGLLVKRIALALEQGHRRRIGVAGPKIESLTVRAGLIGVEQA